MATNWKELYAVKKELERKLRTIAPNMENRAGIYVWYRKQFRFYAGQSVKLVDRSIQHMQQYDHLGMSIRKYGLYSDKNPYGWKITYFYCDESELNEKERETIAKWAENNISYNITSGGQDKGKVDINERAAAKKYTDGLKQGRANAIKEIKVLFDKYLDYVVKGETNKVKERKLNEFKEMLGGNTNE